MLHVWDFVLIGIAVLWFGGTIFYVYRCNQQFRDRSRDIKKGMSEMDVMEVMCQDPISIEPLKDEAYAWVYERKKWKGWAMEIERIEIIFYVGKKVSSIHREKTYEKLPR